MTLRQRSIREQANKLWTQRRKQGWRPCARQWLPTLSTAER
ncbi:MAG: DUF1651 domain-containing protein [Cyanobium sp.]